MMQITIALLSAGFVVLYGSKTGKSRVSCFSSYTSSIPETTTRAAVNMGTKTVGKARPIKTKTVVAIYAKKAAVIAAFFVGEFSSRLRLFREAFG